MIAIMSSVCRGVLAAVAVAALSGVSGAGQASAVEYLPPELSFKATGDAEITATIHNPNGSGICWATIAIDQSVHEFTEYDPSGAAGPGQTVKPVRGNLAAARYQLSGFCGASYTSPGQVKGKDYEVTLPAEKPSTGSFGL